MAAITTQYPEHKFYLSINAPSTIELGHKFYARTPGSNNYQLWRVIARYKEFSLAVTPQLFVQCRAIGTNNVAVFHVICSDN